MFFARITRLIPLVLALLVIGFIIYVVAEIKYSPLRAKQIVLKVFIWITSILTGLFLLVCLYCLLDGFNIPAFELFLSCACVPALGLVITLICRAVFLKNHPSYRHKPTESKPHETFKGF